MNVWETQIGYDLVSETQNFLRQIRRNCFVKKTNTFSVQCRENANEICKTINEETENGARLTQTIKVGETRILVFEEQREE